jgi:hypothetical protein
MVNKMGIGMGMWRRYEIVSASGTHGTYLQRLLVFTTARKKAPAAIIDSLLRRFPTGSRPQKRTAGTPGVVSPAPGA